VAAQLGRHGGAELAALAAARQPRQERPQLEVERQPVARVLLNEQGIGMRHVARGKGTTHGEAEAHRRQLDLQHGPDAPEEVRDGHEALDLVAHALEPVERRLGAGRGAAEALARRGGAAAGGAEGRAGRRAGAHSPRVAEQQAVRLVQVGLDEAALLLGRREVVQVDGVVRRQVLAVLDGPLAEVVGEVESPVQS